MKAMEISKDFIPLLPNELKFKILSYLSSKDLLKAGKVCKSWQKICNDEFLWREICIKEHICTRAEEKNIKTKSRNNSLDIQNYIATSFWKSCYIRQCRLEKIWRTRQTNNYSKIINCNTEMVSCIQINHKYLVSPSFDATINVYLIKTGETFKKLTGHVSAAIIFQLIDNIIISGDGYGIIKIWNIERGECIFNLLGHTNRISCLSIFENKFVSGSTDSSIRVWNFENGNYLNILNGHTAAVRCVDYNGELIISSSSDRTIKIWSTENGECLKTLDDHSYDVKSLKFDGFNIVSASIGSICIWNVETGALKNKLMGCKDCFAFTERNDMRYVKNMFALINVLYSPNPFVRFKYDIIICDFSTGEYLQTLSDPTEESSEVKFMQFVLNFVLTSTFGSTIKLWDIKTGKFIRNLININWHDDGYYVHGFRANETKLVCLTKNHNNKSKLIIMDFDFHHKSTKRLNFMKNTNHNRHCSVV